MTLEVGSGEIGRQREDRREKVFSVGVFSCPVDLGISCLLSLGCFTLKPFKPPFLSLFSSILTQL